MHELDSILPILVPNGNQDAKQLLDSIPQVASAIFGAVSSSIFLWDRQCHELVFYSVSNPAERELVGSRFPAELGIAGWVLSSGEPIVVDDVSHLQVFARDVAEATGHVPKAIMAAPLMHQDRTIGVLEVIDPAPQSRSSLNELELLGLFARQAALSLHTITEVGHATPAAVAPSARAFTALTPQERVIGLRLVSMLEDVLAER
ncbi:GAF domain-containing protein [Streptomyces sp. NPDC096354]|uniref:GAF domain-containing protein n=1 Tax=Streptomyces sp. NPDC096354 TaxID=3366088 RepID=UPI0038280968